MDEFSGRLYPVWKPIQDRWAATLESDDCLSDMELIHRMDMAVHGSGEKPDRTKPVDVEKMRKMDQAREIYDRVSE